MLPIVDCRSSVEKSELGKWKYIHFIVHYLSSPSMSMEFSKTSLLIIFCKCGQFNIMLILSMLFSVLLKEQVYVYLKGARGKGCAAAAAHDAGQPEAKGGHR